MFRKIILGSLVAALSFAATSSFAQDGTDDLRRPDIRPSASNTRPIARPLLRDRVTNNASTTKPRDRALNIASSTRNNASSTKMADSTCAKKAVDARKTSLVSIYATFSSAVSKALSTREDAVRASFDQTTRKERQDARAEARSAYKKSVKSAFETQRTNEKTTMKTYTADIKACGGNNAEASNELSDGSMADSVLK